MQANNPIEDVFRTPIPARDKFLSRLFGLFGEEVVHHWCAQDQARYEDLGRPTLWAPAASRGHTLDFTLRDRDSGRTYVAELKCELEYENYKYLRLVNTVQLRANKRSPAFAAFLEIARAPNAYAVRVAGREKPVDGAILVWGATTPEGRAAVIAERGFADVLSVEHMLHDLRAWEADSWSRRVDELRSWSDYLYDFLRPY
jgi:hypothetical protein